MDEENTLLSHQTEAVYELSKYYDSIFVLTGHKGEYRNIKNVTVVSTHWKIDKPLRNTLIFLFYFLRFYRKNRFVGIFSHMTAVQSALIAPITKIRGITHILWYAHSKNNIFLRWDSFWVSKILTSTKGSCPIKNRKVISIGQAINPKMFSNFNHEIKSKVSGVHIGRFDKSKNIDLIVEAVKRVRIQGPDINFTQIGNPSTKENEIQAELLIEKEIKMHEDCFKFLNGMNRSDIPATLNNYDFFLHGYKGSLDKSILEATILGLPVITINPEYLVEFGAWENVLENNNSLEKELRAYLKMDFEEIRQIVARRKDIALNHHTLNNWVDGVIKAFK